jgi:hypothetical protein
MRRAYLPLNRRLLEVKIVFGAIVVMAGAMAVSMLASMYVVVPAWMWVLLLLQGLSVPLAGAFFLSWLTRACWNVDAVEPGSRRFSDGWVSGAWFVPVVNLYRPLQIVHDVWRAGRVGNEALPTVWWIAFMAWGWIEFIAWWFVRDWSLFLLAQGLTMVAGILALAVAVQATQGLDRRRDELELEEPVSPTGRFEREAETGAAAQLKALGAERS